MRRLAFLLPVLLLACTPPAPPPELTLVLPNPAQPGETVTVYGTWSSPPTVQLDDQVISSTPSADHLTLTLPAGTPAGEHALSLQGNAASSTLNVIPRVDRATLQGNSVRVSGAGWVKDGALLPDTNLVINGLAQTAILSGQDLSAPLTGSGNGVFNVSVSVGKFSSRTVSLLHEAASVTGKVVWPAAQSLTRLPVKALGLHLSSSVVIEHDSPLTLPALNGLQSQQALPVLHATRLTFQTPAQMQVALSILRAQYGVNLVHPDANLSTDGNRAQVVRGQDLPNLGGQWWWPLLGVTNAWKTTTGKGVTVAVVDTGVALGHPDLVKNLLPGMDFLSGGPPQDTVGHGTHVAGLIAASGQVKGAAPDAWIVPVRVLDASSGGSAYVVAQGLLWAAGLLKGVPNPHPADIINISLGTNEYDQSLADAVQQAQDAGVLVVAATGNNTGSLNYPAALPGVLATTAVSGPLVTYQPAYADHGPGTQVTAYGGDLTQDQDKNGVMDGILSTDLNSDGTPGYALRNGTSMASPQVAGIAALALSAGVPRSKLRASLLNSATDLGVLGMDDQYGRGLISAHAATPSTPRSYVLALDPSGKVLGWTPVQADGSYTLSNLPGGPVLLRAASDPNGNGLLGEAGELLSETQNLTLTAGQVSTARDLTLNPSDGRSPFPLP